ncbi:MAG: hypothetical protein Q6365_002590 [Candidatus Sigynarchaeota archaeon]
MMAQTTQKRGYLGFIIAGAVASVSGGSLLAGGFMYLWMGGLFQSLMGMEGIPIPVMGILGTMGTGMAIGGGAALIVGLALLGHGVSRRNASKAATPQQAGTATSWQPAASTGREYPYSSSPAYGSITTPGAPAEPAPSMSTCCRSCGEALPKGVDVKFCPGCGAPTR